MSLCFISATDFQAYWPQVGERVWFFDQKKNGPRYTETGILIRYNEDHSYATVQLGKLKTRIKTVATKRLNRGASLNECS